METLTLNEVPENESTGLEELTRVISTLCRGDAVPLHLIESAYGVSRGSEQFRLKMLATKRLVEQEFMRRENTRVTVKLDKDVGLIVLGAAAASNYNNRAGQNGIKKLRNAHGKMQDVPRSELVDADLARHDQDLSKQGRIVQAVDRESRRRAPDPKPRERQTPVNATNKD